MNFIFKIFSCSLALCIIESISFSFFNFIIEFSDKDKYFNIELMKDVINNEYKIRGI